MQLSTERRYLFTGVPATVPRFCESAGKRSAATLALDRVDLDQWSSAPLSCRGLARAGSEHVAVAMVVEDEATFARFFPKEDFASHFAVVCAKNTDPVQLLCIYMLADELFED